MYKAKDSSIMNSYSHIGLSQSKIYLLSQLPTPTQTVNNSRRGSAMVVVNSDFETATKKVFDLLDGDGDGLISASNLDLSMLDGAVLELIAEVLYRMEDERLVFNC